MEKKVEKKSKEKVKKNPGQKKAGPEAPANPFKKPIQNSKQQPQKWGERQRRERCCFEICIDFLLDLAWLFGRAFFGWIFAPDFLR